MDGIPIYTNSYFEYYLTVLGWFINNGIWDLLVETGLFATPFFAHLIRLWLKVREEGDDEGNKGKLLLNRIEHAFYLSIVVILFTCMPLFTINVNNITYDETRSKQCKVSIISPQQSSMSYMQTTLDGQQAKMPLWWAFTTVVSKAVTQAAITTIPCSPDIRQLRFEVNNTLITSAVLRQEVQDFFEQCYVPARKKIKRKNVKTNEVQDRDLDWIGSRLMVETPNLYDSYRAKMPRSEFPYDPKRDQALPNTGKGGFPKCNEWWDNPSVGLKARLLEQYSPSTIASFKQTYDLDKNYYNANPKRISDSEVADVLVRNLVKPEKIAVSNGKTYSNLSSDIISDDAGGFFAGLRSGLSKLVAGVGTTTTLAVATPGFDAMRQALPMIQGLLSVVFVISIPFVMVFSGYSMKAAMVMTFIQFGLYFLTFWWELARWLDSSLLSGLYGSDTHSYFNLYGLENTEDDTVVKLVIGAMYIVFPGFFMMAMGKAGVEMGNIANNLVIGAKKSEDGGQRYSQSAVNSAENKIGIK
ncbi:conjugal transfer protein TraG N-terminal domain-containing protein [Gallibacterium sp. AGMB14963]|uniref:conjugal transfer protein TraG N-terminal domain-containing protein n=1 Tax=Gallibacterium faecale TaxID=3019086 RepID=UPI0022F17F2E|nr:conjugal transfer protein TraG N-terminal domain-containing protein [Gallibacterium sp. AGMB14963]MDA3978094.1 conjugal transfer protein TraG N-terminal domain-containing protein [Gallibacterium sp. AGMB14963]